MIFVCRLDEHEIWEVIFKIILVMLMWEFDISFSYFSNRDNTVIESVSNFTFLERVLEKIEDVLFKLILLVISFQVLFVLCRLFWKYFV